MNRKVFCVSLISFCLCYAQAFAANSELAPRKGMSPLDRAKIHSVQAQNWSRFGALEATNDDSSSTANSSGSGISGVGSKTCTTNIGTTTTNQGISSGRYGPSNNSNKIVVVKGDVISLCK